MQTRAMATETVNITKIADLPEICWTHHLTAVLGIPASTWRYWAHIGEGPASFKLGRHRVYRREAVLAWIAEAEATAG